MLNPGLPDFGPSGTLHRRGAVPDPGSTVGTTRYLREDSTWISPGGAIAIITKGDIYGLGLVYLTSSTLSVNPGQARDSTDAVNISLTSAQTITVTTNGAIDGNDRTQIAGTVATNSSLATIVGTSTHFLTAFGTRTGSGTITGASTTITGTNTKFLSQVAVGDLIGTNAVGYARVSAIASDTSLTLQTGIPGGSPAGGAPVIIENAWFQAGTQPVQYILSIASDTNMVIGNTGGVTASGLAGFIGPMPSAQAPMHVWLGTGGSGTTVYASTQRTTPFGVSGYNTSIRRVGSFIYTGSAIVPFIQTGQSIERRYEFVINANANNSLVVNNAAATSWTDVLANTLAPPTANVLLLTLQINNTSVGADMSVRARNVNAFGSLNSNIQATVAASATNAEFYCPVACDGAQAFQYVWDTNPSQGGFIKVNGYIESLLPDKGGIST